MNTRTIAELMQADAMPIADDDDPAVGSYEAQLARIGEAVKQRCGCAHTVAVVETYPTFALVRCLAESKAWRVPYEVRDDGAVIAGQFEEHVSNQAGRHG